MSLNYVKYGILQNWGIYYLTILSEHAFQTEYSFQHSNVQLPKLKKEHMFTVMLAE
jgi:hypothetical protein